MGEASSTLRQLAEVLDEETDFLDVLGKLPEPDNEIRTRLIYSYSRLARTLRQKAARVDEMEGWTA